MVGFVQSVPSAGGEQGSLQAHRAQCFYAVQDKYMDIEGTETMGGGGGNFKYAKITRHSAAAKEVTTQVTSDNAAP